MDTGVAGVPGSGELFVEKFHIATMAKTEAEERLEALNSPNSPPCSPKERADAEMALARAQREQQRILNPDARPGMFIC